MTAMRIGSSPWLLLSLATALQWQESSAAEASGPVSAVLFPWFSEILGVCVFFVLTRYCHWLPFTAVMFLVGTLMGIAVTLPGDEPGNNLAESISQWFKIDGHVLLLVFLPGLLFKDAFDVNVHLFKQSIFQLLVMAFPSVLAGLLLPFTYSHMIGAGCLIFSPLKLTTARAPP